MPCRIPVCPMTNFEIKWSSGKISRSAAVNLKLITAFRQQVCSTTGSQPLNCSLNWNIGRSKVRHMASQVSASIQWRWHRQNPFWITMRCLLHWGSVLWHLNVCLAIVATQLFENSHHSTIIISSISSVSSYSQSHDIFLHLIELVDILRCTVLTDTCNTSTWYNTHTHHIHRLATYERCPQSCTCRYWSNSQSVKSQHSFPTATCCRRFRTWTERVQKSKAMRAKCLYVTWALDHCHVSHLGVLFHRNIFIWRHLQYT